MIDLSRFVKLWQQSTSARDVADAFGITPVRARRIAHTLRREGIELHRFAAGRPKPSRARRTKEVA